VVVLVCATAVTARRAKTVKIVQNPMRILRVVWFVIFLSPWFSVRFAPGPNRVVSLTNSNLLLQRRVHDEALRGIAHEIEWVAGNEGQLRLASRP
jgi:hypothetical protein